MEEVLVLSAEELKFEFVIDFDEWIYPVHVEVINILLSITKTNQSGRIKN